MTKQIQVWPTEEPYRVNILKLLEQTVSAAKRRYELDEDYGVWPVEEVLALLETVEAADRELAMIIKWTNDYRHDVFAEQVRQWAESKRKILRTRFQFGSERTT